MKLKPYPAMKDSGVPWLGELPEHWEILPNRTVFTEIKERDHPDADMLSVTITKGVIRQRALLEGSSKKDSSNQDKSAYKFVRIGDIANNKMRAWQGAAGEIDLSHLAGRGVFKAWNERAFFEAVHVSEARAIAWDEDVELCPDALYLQLTGKSIEEVMSGARTMIADA